MAYLKELIHECQNGYCRKRAVVEVFNHFNSSMGIFCRPCSKAKVREVELRERAEFNAPPPVGRQSE